MVLPDGAKSSLAPVPKPGGSAAPPLLVANAQNQPSSSSSSTPVDTVMNHANLQAHLEAADKMFGDRTPIQVTSREPTPERIPDGKKNNLQFIILYKLCDIRFV